MAVSRALLLFIWHQVVQVSSAFRVDLVLEVPHNIEHLQINDRPSSILEGLGEHDMLISQEVSSDGSFEQQYYPTYPESFSLSGIDSEMYERVIEEKELIQKKLEEITSEFRERLDQKFTKIVKDDHFEESPPEEKYEMMQESSHDDQELVQFLNSDMVDELSRDQQVVAVAQKQRKAAEQLEDSPMSVLMTSIKNSQVKFQSLFENDEKPNTPTMVLEQTLLQEGQSVDIDQQMTSQLSVQEMLQYTIELENLMNAQYIGGLYLGSPTPQYAELSFDTGSNWLTVTSSLGSMSGQKGAFDLMRTRTGYAVSPQIINEKYGSTYLSGQIWKDRVCLDKSDVGSCVDDFPFIAIKEETGLMKKMDGILGMGPQLFVVNSKDMKLSREKNPESTSLMEYLKYQKIINETIASFSLQEENQRSYISFGERNMSQIKGGLYSYKLVSQEWWSIDVERFLYDYEMPNFEGSTDIAQAVIDTGTSLLGIPPEHYQYIVALWKQQFGSQISCDQVVCFGKLNKEKEAGQECADYTERMQAVQIMFDSDSVFELKPEAYTFVQENFCIFGLMEFSQSVQKFEESKEDVPMQRVKQEKVQKKGAYLLGGVFLRNYYTIFNWDQKRIEFGVNIEAQDKASIKNADKAFKKKGKENKSRKNIKIDGDPEDKKDKAKKAKGKEKFGAAEQKSVATLAETSRKSHNMGGTAETILDKIDHSVRKIENDINQESIEVKMKSNKIQNLKTTLHNLNKNKKDLIKQRSSTLKSSSLDDEGPQSSASSVVVSSTDLGDSMSTVQSTSSREVSVPSRHSSHLQSQSSKSEAQHSIPHSSSSSKKQKSVNAKLDDGKSLVQKLKETQKKINKQNKKEMIKERSRQKLISSREPQGDNTGVLDATVTQPSISTSVIGSPSRATPRESVGVLDATVTQRSLSNAERSQTAQANQRESGVGVLDSTVSAPSVVSRQQQRQSQSEGVGVLDATVSSPSLSNSVSSAPSRTSQSDSVLDSSVSPQVLSATVGNSLAESVMPLSTHLSSSPASQQFDLVEPTVRLKSYKSVVKPMFKEQQQSAEAERERDKYLPASVTLPPTSTSIIDSDISDAKSSFVKASFDSDKPTISFSARDTRESRNTPEARDVRDSKDPRDSLDSRDAGARYNNRDAYIDTPTASQSASDSSILSTQSSRTEVKQLEPQQLSSDDGSTGHSHQVIDQTVPGTQQSHQVASLSSSDVNAVSAVDGSAAQQPDGTPSTIRSVLSPTGDGSATPSVEMAPDKSSQPADGSAQGVQQSNRTQSLLDKIESNIEQHLQSELEDKISKSIETKLTHNILEGDAKVGAGSGSQSRGQSPYEDQGKTKGEAGGNQTNSLKKSGGTLAPADQQQQEALNGTQSLDQSSHEQQSSAWLDSLNTKIEKQLEDKIEQNIQSKIEDKIEHDLLAKLEEKIQGNLDKKISKTFEQSLQKIDATVSTVASSFSNLTNIIAKKSQDTQPQGAAPAPALQTTTIANANSSSPSTPSSLKNNQSTTYTQQQNSTGSSSQAQAPQQDQQSQPQKPIATVASSQGPPNPQTNASMGGSAAQDGLSKAQAATAASSQQNATNPTSSAINAQAQASLTAANGTDERQPEVQSAQNQTAGTSQPSAAAISSATASNSSESLQQRQQQAQPVVARQQQESQQSQPSAGHLQKN